MNEDQIKLQIASAMIELKVLGPSPRFEVNAYWLLKFAQRVANAAPAQKEIRIEAEPEINSLDRLIDVKPVTFKPKAEKLTEPPPGSIDHQAMLEIILARREIKTARELGDMIGCDPAMITQVCNRFTPVSERVARGFGYQRHKVGDQFWFKKINHEPPVEPPRPAQSAVKANDMPRIVRSSPFENIPAVRQPGPWQQLLDSAQGAT